MAHLILYDGDCGLCSRIVQFVLARDHEGRFRFAALQSGVAERELARYGRDPGELNTMYLIQNHGSSSERLLARGRAGLRVLRDLGGAWRVTSMLGLLPTALLDAGYDVIAKNRYRFGRPERCRLPSAQDRAKFLDLAEALETPRA
jgi:predicted DCC family thiol-disulfide oxidoreductase YuxK